MYPIWFANASSMLLFI